MTETPAADIAMLSPAEWGSLLAPEPPPLQHIDGGALCHWSGTAPIMRQPPLDHHYLAMHLGGPKRVRRDGEGPTVQREVAVGSITVVPAGSAFTWATSGPIEYAHLYIAPRRLDRTVRNIFDRDPGTIALLARIGWEDPLVSALMQAIIDPMLDGNPDGRLARDSWYEALLARLVQAGSSLSTATPRARNALAPRTLARLKQHIDANLANEVTLDQLAAVAGLSRFHLCRAFRETTGFPPHAYLTRARLQKARQLLRAGNLPIREIARLCGFASPNQFATSFRKHIGSTPSAYRQAG